MLQVQSLSKTIPALFLENEAVMRISVIIPALNEASTISSFLQHTTTIRGIHEVIVVDGGSTDGTPDIARKYARVIEGPRGRALQMNAGATEADGDVFLFLHADTILPLNAAQAIQQSLFDGSVVGGRFRVRLDNTGWRYRMVSWSINMRDSLIRGFTGDQAIFVRRDIFNNMGGYPPLALMEDLAFGRCMYQEGKVVRLPDYVITSARRWESGGVLRTVFLMWRLRLLYFMKFPSSLLMRWYGDPR